LPVEQPNKFEFIVNLKTAKALVLEVSPTFSALAPLTDIASWYFVEHAPEAFRWCGDKKHERSKRSGTSFKQSFCLAGTIRILEILATPEGPFAVSVESLDMETVELPLR
jgi:hypothetical protein